MNKRIIEDVNIKCEKCGRDIGFKVYYESSNETGDNKYKKSNLDDVEVCSCSGAYKQYVSKYNDLPSLITR